jgi:hypothetical protein
VPKSRVPCKKPQQPTSIACAAVFWSSQPFSARRFPSSFATRSRLKIRRSSLRCLVVGCGRAPGIVGVGCCLSSQRRAPSSAAGVSRRRPPRGSRVNGVAAGPADAQLKFACRRGDTALVGQEAWESACTLGLLDASGWMGRRTGNPEPIDELPDRRQALLERLCARAGSD